MKKLMLSLVLASALGLGLATGTAFAGTYLGDGYFGSDSLKWLYDNDTSDSTYSTPVDDAIDEWDDDTQLTLTETFGSDWDITVRINDYGPTTWSGYGYICSGINCDNSTAWANTYSWAIAKVNDYYTDTMSQTERQRVTRHELGHTFSLGHNSVSGSIMGPNTCECVNGPNSTDIFHIDDRY